MATLVETASHLVASHVKCTPMSTDELLAEIGKVHAALKKLEVGEVVESHEPVKPVVPVKGAFKKNEVLCLVCGKGGFKTLARHLNAAHGMRPGEYKKQFGIPKTQSLAAKTYSKARKAMAHERGLAENLAKARAVRMANIAARKGAEKASASKTSRSGTSYPEAAEMSRENVTRLIRV